MESSPAEEEPLLPPAQDVGNNPTHMRTAHRKANIWWLIPVIATASLSRGMTNFPRYIVYWMFVCPEANRPIGPSLVMQPGSIPMPTILESSRPGSCMPFLPPPIYMHAVVMIVTCIVSAITTGWWSRFGDLHGRRSVLFLTILGGIFLEIAFILVAYTDTIFRKYIQSSILIGVVLENSLGGLSTFNGVTYAYAADCTANGSRSKTFSILQGITLLGLLCGSMLGGALSAGTYEPENIYIPFLMSSALALANLLFVALILPESSSEIRTEDGGDTTHPAQTTLGPRNGFKVFVQATVSPITKFVPTRADERHVALLGLALFVYSLTKGIEPFKLTFALEHRIPIQIGWYALFQAVAQLVTLLGLLPTFIWYIKPKIRVLIGGVPPPEEIVSDMNFDKSLAEYSVLVDAISEFLVAIATTTSHTLYIIFISISPFTSGALPAMYSLGAAYFCTLGRSSEIGSLFGALSVLYSVGETLSFVLFYFGSQPAASNFPSVVFFLAAGLLTAVVLLLSPRAHRIQLLGDLEYSPPRAEDSGTPGHRSPEEEQVSGSRDQT